VHQLWGLVSGIHSIARVSGCLLSRLDRKLMHIWCVDVADSLGPSPLGSYMQNESSFSSERLHNPFCTTSPPPFSFLWAYQLRFIDVLIAISALGYFRRLLAVLQLNGSSVPRWLPYGVCYGPGEAIISRCLTWPAKLCQKLCCRVTANGHSRLLSRSPLAT